MSLLITIATGDGIVLAADSALTKMKGDKVTITLSNFPKIIPIPALNAGISFAGNLIIGNSAEYISSWIRNFISNSKSAKLEQFADDLVIKLNQEELQMDQLRVFNLAGWTSESVPKPKLFEVSNLEGEYKCTQLISDDLIQEMVDWQTGKSESYPITVLSAGMPKNYATWISEEGIHQHSSFVENQIPYPNITAVAEYARFLIRSIADLYQISRQPKIVDEPIETLIIFPRPVKMLSTKY